MTYNSLFLVKTHVPIDVTTAVVGVSDPKGPIQVQKFHSFLGKTNMVAFCCVASLYGF